MFIDSHCHLGFPDLGGHGTETQKIIQEAKDNKVGIILNIATTRKTFDEYINFSNKNDSVYCALGIHPLYIQENKDFNKKDIIKYLSEKKLIGVGETGLDYYYSTDNIKQQKKYFELHAQISSEYNLPIIIHTREAQKDTVDMLSYFVKNLGISGVIHCFSGDKKLARQLLDIGFYISLSGIVTFKKSIDLHEVAHYLPSDRILTETDAPYLAPVPYRGKINKPSYVRYTTEYIASLREEKITNLTHNINLNFFRLFNKANALL